MKKESLMFKRTWNCSVLFKILLTGLCLTILTNAQTVPQKKVQPFKLNQVKLLPGPFKNAMDRKCSYLLFLNNDRLLYWFRATNNLPTQGVQSYGSWENMGGIKGHTMGHVLSGLAQAYQSTGDSRYKTKAEALITELQKCQNASGYLAAIPESDVNTLLNLGNIWAPFYNIHKTFAGLLDCHELLGNTTALDMAKKLGDWSYNKLKPFNHDKYQQFWNDRQSAAGEFGGYNESLAELYIRTSKEDYLTAAHFFDHDKLFNPCLANTDGLNGLHANTSIPEIIGALKIYEASGDQNSYKIAQNFFDIVIGAHTYINGGNSENEYFKAPKDIAGQLTDKTCETCNVYNMLKLARQLFIFDPQPKYMDYYERALYNQILASQDTASAHGFCTYFQPLRSGGIKTYGNDEGTFYCCDGTGLENHTKYGGSIFFSSGDTLLVNLFIPSELTWPEKNMTIKMETAYPHSDTIRLTITGSGTMPLKIRAPFWLQKQVLAGIDGDLKPVAVSKGSYFTLNKAWSGSSDVTIVLPQSIRYEISPDNAKVGGVMYGAQLLAGAYGNTNLSSIPSLDASTVKKSDGSTLRFTATASTGSVNLIPFYQMHHQRYSVYWNLNNVVETFSRENIFTGNSKIANVSLGQSGLLVDFQNPSSQSTQVTVSQFTINGKFLTTFSLLLASGEKRMNIPFPSFRSTSNIYIYKVTVGDQTFTRLIGCEK
jgi:DUF1680 family protein